MNYRHVATMKAAQTTWQVVNDSDIGNNGRKLRIRWGAHWN